MKVDIQSLGTFQQLAHEGAEQAAGSLSQLTGVDTRVDVTNVTLMTQDDLAASFADREFVGVHIGVDGLLSGRTMLAFERESARTIARVLVDDPCEDGISGMARSSVEEAGNIMLGGFLDGWADYLETGIDMTTPEYVERTGVDVVPDGALDGREDSHVLVFESRMRAVEETLSFYIYMFPESDGLLSAVDDRESGDQSIPLEKLSVFNEMTREGVSTAADNITSMTGIDTTVDVSRIRFVPVESVPEQADEERYVGTVLEYEGLPSGYLAFLFDEPSGRRLAEALLPTESDEDWGEMEQSAITELGNIMTSGFIDGWANVLQTTIDHSPPQFVHDMGSSILSPMAGRLGQAQQYAFVIDATVETPDSEVGCDIYALPDADELGRALRALEVDRAGEVNADQELHF